MLTFFTAYIRNILQLHYVLKNFKKYVLKAQWKKENAKKKNENKSYNPTGKLNTCSPAPRSTYKLRYLSILLSHSEGNQIVNPDDTKLNLIQNLIHSNTLAREKKRRWFFNAFSGKQKNEASDKFKCRRNNPYRKRMGNKRERCNHDH